MTAIRSFFRREPVLTVAAAAALISCFFVPPDRNTLSSIDFRTLTLLYVLMVVVSGLRRAGVFTAMASTLCSHVRHTRALGAALVCLSFFSSMLITNDVALLTFVPFASVVLSMAGRQSDLPRVAVLQSVAANLGSMLTPVGNPQNLYLYAHYQISLPRFFGLTAPVWALSLVLLLLGCLLLPQAPVPAFPAEKKPPDGGKTALYVLLFAVCLLTVARVLSAGVLLAIVAAVLLIFDRKNLLRADFMLLLTFVAFFIFAGNLSRIEPVSDFLRSFLAGREYWTALAASQVVSNVPAALLLSGFTENAGALLLGVDIGGLGTPIASLASLIAYKLYAQTENARPGRFFAEFLLFNAAFLLLLSVFAVFVLL